MIYRTLALCSVLVLGLAWSARGADAPATPKPAAKPVEVKPEEAAVSQEILARQFRDFEQSLLRLAQRLERSSKPEDRERAANLKKAIALASDERTEAKFDKLIDILKSSKALSVQEIRDAMDQNKMLADDIRAILALLLADSRDSEIQREKKRLMELLKELDKVIRAQKVVRAQTESGRTDKDPLGKAQNKVTKDTGNIAKAMGKDGKGEGKDSKSEGKDSKGEGKDSRGKGQGQGQGQESKPGEKKANQPMPPSDPNQKPPEGTPGRKQVQDANEYQKKAEEDIKKDKRDEASTKQDKAIKELEEARKKLEEILRQLREEEIERLLAALQARCERMLQMQIEVWHGTVGVDKAIAENPDKKPTRVNEQKALQLSDREEEIVKEANKAIAILEAEGSAVAFYEVFTQVRDDMKNVARRLGKADVGSVTQVIEQDIISLLKEMIEALKKARQNMANKPSQSQPGPPQDQKLLDLLAELKMIRSMQVRVNSRTRVYGEKYTGEQAADPDIQKELVNLAQRQEKIFEVTNDIYRGKNK
jgi:hypothetical protein